MTSHSKTRVLVFPGEAENAFELFQALRYSTRFEVWGASSRPGYGSWLFPRYRDDLPHIDEENFLMEFNRFIGDHQISLVFATHDQVALFLAEQSSALKATLVGSGVECARLCRDKSLLYTTLAGEAFCPRTYALPQAVEQWPVFIKPSRSQGGVGGARANDLQTLLRLWSQTSEPVVSEYLPGEEFTIDCFSDRHGRLLFAGPRSRDVVKMGIAFESRTVALDAATQHIAEVINAKLKPRGLWFFQTKRSHTGALKLLEVSCRAAGTMGVYRQQGVNLPLLAAYDALGLDVRVLKNEFPVSLRRRLLSSYKIDHSFSTVYVDYDDTVIVDGEVNAALMQFLYTCRNRNKKLVLISRHAGDLKAHMRAFRVFPELFDQIHHIADTEKKSDYVTESSAILIDNLFVEREEVLARTGVPVFDVDAIEGLL